MIGSGWKRVSSCVVWLSGCDVQPACERLGKQSTTLNHTHTHTNCIRCVHCLVTLSPPNPWPFVAMQAAYERMGKESMSLKDALTVMKQRSAEMAVKAQVNGSVQTILVLAVSHFATVGS